MGFNEIMKKQFTVHRKTPPKATSSPNITAVESWESGSWEHFLLTGLPRITFVRAMSSASVTDWRSVIFSVGPGNKIRRRLYQEPRNEIIPHDWLKKIAFSFSSSKSTRIVYHLQGWVSLAQTESGQHAQWLRSGWVVIWKKVWVCHINFSGLNLSILPAQKAGGAPDSSSGHASACLLDPQTIDAEIFLFSFDWWYIVFFYISVIITLCSLSLIKSWENVFEQFG